MKKFNYIASAKRTLKIESDSISAIGKQLKSSFTILCEKVMASKGKFVIMGVGKSGHITENISNIVKYWNSFNIYSSNRGCTWRLWAL